MERVGAGGCSYKLGGLSGHARLCPQRSEHLLPQPPHHLTCDQASPRGPVTSLSHSEQTHFQLPSHCVTPDSWDKFLPFNCFLFFFF